MKNAILNNFQSYTLRCGFQKAGSFFCDIRVTPEIRSFFFKIRNHSVDICIPGWSLLMSLCFCVLFVLLIWGGAKVCSIAIGQILQICLVRSRSNYFAHDGQRALHVKLENDVCWKTTSAAQDRFSQVVTQENGIKTWQINAVYFVVKTIGNPCSNDADCLETNSICLGGICFCNSTTKYNKVICSCDKGKYLTFF